jgi:hypothetical protein
MTVRHVGSGSSLSGYAVADSIHPIRDGGSSGIVIRFCPWCGVRLPESKRDRWHAEIESLGLNPDDDALPDRYATGQWYRQRTSEGD